MQINFDVACFHTKVSYKHLHHDIKIIRKKEHYVHIKCIGVICMVSVSRIVYFTEGSREDDDLAESCDSVYGEVPVRHRMLEISAL